jgi:hypothetical protein
MATRRSALCNLLLYFIVSCADPLYGHVRRPFLRRSCACMCMCVRVRFLVDIDSLCQGLQCDELCEVTMSNAAGGPVAYCVCTVGYIKVRVDQGFKCNG